MGDHIFDRRPHGWSILHVADLDHGLRVLGADLVGHLHQLGLATVE